MSTLGEYPVVRYSKANGSGAAIASHVFDRLEKFRRAGLLKGILFLIPPLRVSTTLTISV